MNTLPSSARVVIIGGGVMGLFTAWECAQRGEKDIIVLERRSLLGAGSTQKSAGGVRAQFTTAANVRMSKYSQGFYRRRFPSEINPHFKYEDIGYLFIARTEEKLRALDEAMALQRKLGVDAVRHIGPEEMLEMLPELNVEDVLGGSFSPEDGFVDPGDIVNGLDTSLRALGVSIYADTKVTTLDSDSDFSHQVITRSGSVRAERVLFAAGAWTASLLRNCRIKIPVEPYRRSLFITAPLPWFPPRSPFTFDTVTGTHFRPESGGILFLKINPDEGPSYNEEPDWDWLENIVPDLMHLVPRLEEAEVIDAWAGLYAMTPDHSAILGPLPGRKGLHVATGFSGHGLMHAPAVACAMAEYLLDGETSTLDVSPYRLERFATGELIHETAVF